jgi:glycerate 2-kinase
VFPPPSNSRARTDMGGLYNRRRRSQRCYHGNMKVLVAPDKFKGSLTAREAAGAMARGVKRAVPGAVVVTCPVADGGEGTVDAVVAATGALERRKTVGGPIPGQEVEARWACLLQGMPVSAGFADRQAGSRSTGERTAVIEMAQASGQSMVKRHSDLMSAGTLGTGELIIEAMDSGCARIIVGAGGSGTVDCGIGMAVALGYRFLDGRGVELAPVGSSMEKVRAIDISGRDPRITGTAFIAACDVDNPLLGEQGAARVYGPQKGASPEQVEELERGLANMGGVLKRELGVDILRSPGAGAAGGLGAGLVAFCGADVVRGFDFVAEAVGLREKVQEADMVLTGEGSFDSQSARGKAPGGVVEIASGAGVPVVVVAGSVEGNVLDGNGGVAAYSVVPGPIDLDEAIRKAGELLASGTERLMRLVLLLPGGQGRERRA